MKARVAAGNAPDDFWKRVSAAKPGLSKSSVSLSMFVPADKPTLEAIFTDTEHSDVAASVDDAEQRPLQDAADRWHAGSPVHSLQSCSDADEAYPGVAADYESVSGSLESDCTSDSSAATGSEVGRQEAAAAPAAAMHMDPCAAARSVLRKSALLAGARQDASASGQPRRGLHSSPGEANSSAARIKQA